MLRPIPAVVLAICAAVALSSCDRGGMNAAAPTSFAPSTAAPGRTPAAERTRDPSIPTPTPPAPPVTYAPPVDYILSMEGGIVRTLDRTTQYRLAPDRNSIWIHGTDAWEHQT